MDENTFDLSEQLEEAEKGPEFTAQFDSICNVCDDGIEVGDSARYDLDGAVVHSECA